MRKIYEILTPENVHLEYELGGLGSRFGAFLIDGLLQGVLVVLVAIGMAISKFDFEGFKRLDAWIIAIGILLIFFIFFGYYLVFDLILHGQSPGKRVMGLKVIKQNGEPIGFWESLLRNILRLADFLPTFNLAGALFIAFSKKYQRIGDFAANTIVVKIKKDIQPVNLESIIKLDVMEDEGPGMNQYPVNHTEYGILKEFLARKESLGNRKRVFVYHLNKYFMQKFSLEKPPFENPEDFFQEIIRGNSGV
ncbi:MAG: RDD family protein [Clostridia bacterium]|nr:RDD family protein [Clostridia bacterium]